MRASITEDRFANLTFVSLKDEEWLSKQRIAGKVAAGALALLAGLVKEKSKLSMLEMSALAEQYILDNGCTPTFKGYTGGGPTPFPAAVCISINDQLVHGCPTDYVLQDGDLVSFDLGATFKGAVGDTAITVMYGEPKSTEHIKLIQATQEALQKGIEAAVVGNRIGDIGYAIYKCAKGYGYNVIDRYGGHGISMTKDGESIPHAQPFVSNRSTPSEGIRIKEGLVIAIEPLLTAGSTETWVGSDGWTVYTRNMSCHFEHSIYVHSNGPEIITKLN